MSDPDFYALSAHQFEEFVANILLGQGYFVTRATTGKLDRGIDILANKDGRTIGIQVKHVRQLSVTSARSGILTILETAPEVDEAWFVTSARLSSAVNAMISKLTAKPFRVIDGEELLKIVNATASNIAKDQIRDVAAKKRRQWLIATLTMLVAVSGMTVERIQSKTPLDERIQNVGAALDSLKDLEKQLTEIKSEMAETQQARLEMEQAYINAKELEKLTVVQLAAVRAAVQTRTWHEIMIENAWAFVLGAGSSIFASATWEKYLRWKSQRAQ